MTAEYRGYVRQRTRKNTVVMGAADITDETAKGSTSLRARQDAATCAVVVHRSLASAEHTWRRLEATASATPYQGFAFCKAWYETVGAAEGAEPLIIHLADPARGLELLWPLARARKGGCRIAHFAGGKHANYNLPLGTLDRMTGTKLRQLLRAAARQHGIDLVVLEDQPRHWGGQAHPLTSVTHTASPSSAWSTDLLADPDAMTARLMSAESLKKLRKKERKLGEYGPVTYGAATTQAEVDAALAAFLAHKTARFAAMGVANPFAAPATVAFLQRIAAVSVSGAPLQFHTLKAGDTVAALFGGMVQGGRFSGMITSFDGDPALARCSPGDLLLLHMIRTMGRDGLTQFDLGIGEAAYKAGYCPQEDHLFDSCFAATAKGAVAGSARMLLTQAKRRIKASPRLFALARRFQRL
jgi:CelD/BcsL family acetyltransferase involved in cellulose biosynthesis